MKTLNETILEVKNLKKSFKAVKAVKDFSITITEGEIVALLVPNGAGKTTTLNCLTTLLKPDFIEKLIINGVDVTHSINNARKYFGICPQHLNLYERSTAKENLELQGYYANYPKSMLKKRVKTLLEVVDLTDNENEFVKNLSGGMKRRLQIARALLTEPKLIMLDEPSVGLSPETRQTIWAHIRKLKTLGYSILLTTHYMEEADQLADRVYIMNRGSIVAEGTPESLKQQFMSNNRIFIRSEVNFDLLVSHLEQKHYSFNLIDRQSVLLDPKNVKLSILIKDLEGIEIEEFTMKKPNLEDVFLEITGNTLSIASSETLGSGLLEAV